jgi:hypothetical protein
MATPTDVVLRQAEAFGRHGVAAAPHGPAARMLGPLWMPFFASCGPMLIDAISGWDAKPPIGFFAGHYPEPF